MPHVVHVYKQHAELVAALVKEAQAAEKSREKRCGARREYGGGTSGRLCGC